MRWIWDKTHMQINPNQYLHKHLFISSNIISNLFLLDLPNEVVPDKPTNLERIITITIQITDNSLMEVVTLERTILYHRQIEVNRLFHSLTNIISRTDHSLVHLEQLLDLLQMQVLISINREEVRVEVKGNQQGKIITNPLEAQGEVMVDKFLNQTLDISSSNRCCLCQASVKAHLETMQDIVITRVNMGSLVHSKPPKTMDLVIMTSTRDLGHQSSLQPLTMQEEILTLDHQQIHQDIILDKEVQLIHTLHMEASLGHKAHLVPNMVPLTPLTHSFQVHPLFLNHGIILE